MSISKEDVKKVATLARLRFKDEEIEKIATQMGGILDYVELLKELNTDNVQPTAHVLPLQNVLREDEVTNNSPSKTIFSNAPQAEENQFKVPQVIE